MMNKKLDDASPAEQPRTVSDEDWDDAVMFGQYSRADGQNRVTFTAIDLAAYLDHVRAESAENVNLLRGLLELCLYPIRAAKATADTDGDKNESRRLANLLRKIESALRETGE